jgi:hypothetical protein
MPSSFVIAVVTGVNATVVTGREMAIYQRRCHLYPLT